MPRLSKPLEGITTLGIFGISLPLGTHKVIVKESGFNYYEANTDNPLFRGKYLGYRPDTKDNKGFKGAKFEQPIIKAEAKNKTVVSIPVTDDLLNTLTGEISVEVFEKKYTKDNKEKTIKLVELSV